MRIFKGLFYSSLVLGFLFIVYITLYVAWLFYICDQAGWGR